MSVADELLASACAELDAWDRRDAGCTPRDPRDVTVVAGPTLVAVGFSACVLKTRDGHCIRVARSAEAARRHEREAAVLDVVADQVDVEVPWPSRTLPASERWLYGAVVRPWLDGSHLTDAADPAPVAALLEQLQAINPAALDGLVEPFDRWCERQLSTATAGIAAISGLVEPILCDWLEDIVELLGRELAELTSPSVVHGDLWHENMLAPRRRLSGVLDWEDAGIGDPAVDLAGLWYLGDAWVQQVVGVLDAPERFLRRVAYWRVARELRGAAWSGRHDDASELAESAAKVGSLAAVFHGSLDVKPRGPGMHRT